MQNQLEERLSVKWRTLKQVEVAYIDLVMAAVNGSINAAARLLGLHRRSLQRKLDKFAEGRWRRPANVHRRRKASLDVAVCDQDEANRIAAWLGSHMYWPVKDRVDWRLQPWSHEMRELIEQYENEAKGFARQA